MIALTSNEIHHAQCPHQPAGPQPPAQPALFGLAAQAPAPCQDQPLPKTRINMKISVYGCRNRSTACRMVLADEAQGSLSAERISG
jgi:hypothetical protein